MKAVISIKDEDERTIVQAVQELFDQVRKVWETEMSRYRETFPSFISPRPNRRHEQHPGQMRSALTGWSLSVRESGGGMLLIMRAIRPFRHSVREISIVDRV
jgi:hypothetical protein